MAELLQTIERETGDDPDAAIIWLHGLGADGNDFVPIVPELELGARSMRFVFPHAPTMPVTINGGMIMRAWYDISDAAIRREDEAGVRASQARVEALIEREIRRGIPASRLVLAGFSQGGAIALHTGLRHAGVLAGIMALSCYLPLAATLAAERSTAATQTPIFMAHGQFDPVVAHARAVESRTLLQGLGCSLEWHEYPMQHSLCGEEVRDIARWLDRVLA